MRIDIKGVYGDPDGVIAEDIIKQINMAGGDDIDIYIDSPGGALYDADLIRVAMKAYKGKITAHIAPFAASAASYTCTAADSVVCYPDSVYMIHLAAAMVFGNSHRHRAAADHLDSTDIRIAEAYAAFSKTDMMKILEQMTDETWLESEDILTAGFATEYADTDDRASFPAVANAREQFSSMAAAMAGGNEQTKRIGALKLWRNRCPENPEIERLVSAAIKNGQTENDIMARLLVAERDGGGRLTTEDIQAAKAVGMDLQEYRKYRTVKV